MSIDHSGCGSCRVADHLAISVLRHYTTDTVSHQGFADDTSTSIAISWLPVPRRPSGVQGCRFVGLTHPQAVLAAALAGTSLALWGVAWGALVRNARLFELLALAAVHLGLQGSAVLNMLAAPADAALVLAGLPAAFVMLWLGWHKGLAASC